MAGQLPSDTDLQAAALAWTRRQREMLCDRVQPWAHGNVLRCTRYPSWYDLNLVRVEDDPEMTPEALIEFADRALSGLGHRMVSFERADAAARVRADLQSAGWQVHPLVWMHHEDSVPPGMDPATPADSRSFDIREVHYDAVAHLRNAWHREDFPDVDPTEFHAQQREALAGGTRVLALHDEEGHPIGFAALDPGGDQIEIGAVYVLPDYRGHGRGTTLTAAAIKAAEGCRHMWICADAEGRPRHLYERLGFRPVLETVDFLRLP